MKPYKETRYSTLQDSSEDGIDVEVTDYKTVDDNLDFNTRYTTVLKERATGRMVAIVDFNGDEDVNPVLRTLF
jgi:pyruvate/2-oxoglutarate/acetoin dehydrogenase E1 component